MQVAESLKIQLIQQILHLQDIARLNKIAILLQELKSEDELIQNLAKPTRKALDIDVLKKEQGFTPINKQSFFKSIDELHIEESIEDLIDMI